MPCLERFDRSPQLSSIEGGPFPGVKRLQPRSQRTPLSVVIFFLHVRILAGPRLLVRHIIWGRLPISTWLTVGNGCHCTQRTVSDMRMGRSVMALVSRGVCQCQIQVLGSQPPTGYSTLRRSARVDWGRELTTSYTKYLLVQLAPW